MEIVGVPNLLRTPEASSADDRRQPPKRQPRRRNEKVTPGVVYAPDGSVNEDIPKSGPHIDVTA